MVLKNDGRQRESIKKRRHKFVKCDACGHRNDYDLMLLNDDIDKVGSKEYLYCEQCGEQIEVK